MPSYFLPGRRTAQAAALAAALAAMILSAAAAWAQNYVDPSAEGPLTQADIDAYIYIAPRLQGGIMQYPELAAKVRNEAKLTRRRAIYLTAKIPLAQALARGLISPSRLVDAQVPVPLHPTTEEVKLVSANMHTLMQAESEAIDFSGVKVPLKWRKAPSP